MPEIEKNLRVFISHCSKDHSIARELYLQLIAEGWMELWFIESNLKPSQNWDAEIRAAVENSDVVIALLSKNSTKREEHIYPDPHFIFDIIESRSGGDVLLIPLQLDNSIDLEESEVILYFPKKHRRLIYSQILSKLKSHAKQQGFSTDVVVREPESEERLQWSPTKWRELGGIFGGEVIDEESFEQKPARPPSKWRSKVFAGASRLLYFSLTLIAVFFIAAIGLVVNFVNTGETVNTVAEPIISRVLSILPLPTPTLGVGDSRVSPLDGMRMVYVPAGEFIMGSNTGRAHEKPIRYVYVDAFWIDQYEVTNEMYALCVADGMCAAPLYTDGYYDNPQKLSYPIIGVSWNDANLYCSWAGRRLPTEAEWEKAARGAKGRIYPWGQELSCDRANYFTGDLYCVGNASHVGSYETGKSPYGAYDMSGNVWEWAYDWYDVTYYPNAPYENPMGPATGIAHVLRGGSWSDSEETLRTSYRLAPKSDAGSFLIGFRCALGITTGPNGFQPIALPTPTLEIVTRFSPVDGMAMVYVPTGEFFMGSEDGEEDEKPIHEVYLDGYWIDQFEVTNEMYAKCVHAGGCRWDHGAFLQDIPDFSNYPAIFVLWEGANNYCQWVGRRLPTEAEWEKAAGGNDSFTYPWGENIGCRYANYSSDIGQCVGFASPVGTYESGVSKYGAYDMAGNVSEWVYDLYDKDYYGNSPYFNPLGPADGGYHVFRGGSWANDADAIRTHNRFAIMAQIRYDTIGFRCALSE